MVLKNHIELQNNIPARLHLVDHTISPRTIADSVTGRPAYRNVLEFQVDRLDGKPVMTTWSTMAEKLASTFEPYLRDKSYRNFEILITQTGDGYMRRWSVQFIPLSQL